MSTPVTRAAASPSRAAESLCWLGRLAGIGVFDRHRGRRPRLELDDQARRCGTGHARRQRRPGQPARP